MAVDVFTAAGLTAGLVALTTVLGAVLGAILGTVFGVVFVATLEVVAWVGVLTLLLAAFTALAQHDIKRILAYSSIAHMGYLLIALLGVSYLSDVPFAVETALVYLAGYTLMTLTAFSVVSALSNADIGDDAQDLVHYHGLFWRRPIAASCLAVALLSLMGMPLTLGFVGKFYLLATGVQGAMWLLLWSLIIGSAISVYYYVKVIYAMTLSESTEPYPYPIKSGADLPTMVTLGVLVVVIGAYPSPLIDAVRTLMGDFGL